MREHFRRITGFSSLLRQHYRDVHSVCVAGCNSADEVGLTDCYVLIHYRVAAAVADWRQGHATFLISCARNSAKLVISALHQPLVVLLVMAGVINAAVGMKIDCGQKGNKK